MQLLLEIGELEEERVRGLVSAGQSRLAPAPQIDDERPEFSTI